MPAGRSGPAATAGALAAEGVVAGAGDLGDVFGDRFDFFLGEDAGEGRHDFTAVRHLGFDQRFFGFEFVEVGADRAGRARLREGVTGGAVGGEGRLAFGQQGFGAGAAFFGRFAFGFGRAFFGFGFASFGFTDRAGSFFFAFLAVRRFGFALGFLRFFLGAEAV